MKDELIDGIVDSLMPLVSLLLREIGIPQYFIDLPFDRFGARVEIAITPYGFGLIAEPMNFQPNRQLVSCEAHPGIKKYISSSYQAIAFAQILLKCIGELQAQKAEMTDLLDTCRKLDPGVFQRRVLVETVSSTLGPVPMPH